MGGQTKAYQAGSVSPLSEFVLVSGADALFLRFEEAFTLRSAEEGGTHCLRGCEMIFGSDIVLSDGGVLWKRT